MADAADSKSAAPCGRVGSTPISGTKAIEGNIPKTDGGAPGGAPRSENVVGGQDVFLVWATSTRAAVLSDPSSV